MPAKSLSISQILKYSLCGIALAVGALIWVAAAGWLGFWVASMFTDDLMVRVYSVIPSIFILVGGPILGLSCFAPEKMKGKPNAR
ncbi:hypothetical protein LCGC14_1916940 [marine sediment metagenome]|uniref:Uncharacterized protein n=1 Tax=marine sediment metagenome TaxID=412755 RepID=A0A0F9I5V8_9ZZZZ